MRNGNSIPGPPVLARLEIREDAIYARIAGLIAADPVLTPISASEVAEGDIQNAADRPIIREMITLLETMLESQIALVAIHIAEKRLREADHA